MSEISKEEIEKGFRAAILIDVKKAKDPLKFLTEMKENVEGALRKIAKCNLASGDELSQDYKLQLRVIKLLILREEERKR